MYIENNLSISSESGVIQIETLNNIELKKILELICAQNEYIIKRIDEISKNNVADLENLNKDIRDRLDLGDEIHKSFKDKELTYKQYYVLKYHLANPYVSDIYLSNETEVSYSSISQWKHGNKIFRDYYDRIKSSK